MAVEEQHPQGKAGRLDTDAWVRAAGLQLANAGIDGVRVELIAKRLGVTKGSFYWHFKDRDALLAAILHDWRSNATMAIIDSLEKSGAPAEARLRRVLELPLRRTLHDEVGRGIRLWARTDPRAAQAIEEIDGLRRRYIAGLYQQLGCEPQIAQAYAALVYGYTRTGTGVPAAIVPDIEAILIPPTLRLGAANPEASKPQGRGRGSVDD